MDDASRSGGANDNNANIMTVIKNVQNAQATAKGNRSKIKRGSTPYSSGDTPSGTQRSGLFSSMWNGAKNMFSGEPLTRFNRNRGPLSSSTPSSRTASSSPYGRSGSGSSGFMSGNYASSRGAANGGPRGSYGDGDGYGDRAGKVGSLKRLFGMDEVTRVLYILKFMRLFVVAGALYLASKTFQTRYVTAVFVNNEAPPSLMGFILTFVVIELIFMALIMFIVMLLAKTLDINEVFPITDEVFSLFLFDSIVSSILTAILGVMLAMVVMKKKYFRYRTDGMRAIRSLQEMMFNIAVITSLLPYYIIER